MKKLFALPAILLLATLVHATIHYTSVGEEVSASSPRQYDLDLDGDNDFRFTVVDINPSTGTASFFIESAKTTSYYAAEGASDTLPKAYAEGAALGTYHWQNTKGLLASPAIGNFNNSSKYLTVKFSDGTNTYNGWIYLQKSGFSNLVVNGFAYSDVPDEIITAGETEPTGVPEIDPASFSIAQLNRQQISFQHCTEYDRVSVYNLEGKVVTEIENPVALHNYSLEQANGVLLIAFFKEERLLYSARHFIHEKE